MTHLTREILEDILPLTPAQEGILFHCLNDPASGVYFQQTVLTLTGRLDRAVFRKAVSHLVQNNEGLRMVFRWKDLSKPVQVLLKEQELPLHFSVSDASVHDLLKQDAAREINIEEHPVRMMIVSRSDREHTLLVSFHHIALDGWSFGLLMKKLLNTYNEWLRCDLAEQPMATKAVIKTFLNYQQNRSRNEEAVFWKKNLAAFSANLNLPYQTLQQEDGAGRFLMDLDSGLMNSIHLCARNNRISVASIFYAAWALLLYKTSGESFITFGTTTAGRPPEISGIENTIGMFINTLPFHLIIIQEQSIASFLNQVNTASTALVEYGLASIPEIKEYAGINASTELFNTLCVIENYPVNLDQDTELAVHSFETFEQTNYEITLSVLPFRQKSALLFSYKKKSFDQRAIERMGEYMKRICECLVKENGTQPVNVLDEGRLFKTGDITGDENKSSFIKIKGYRISIKEIEDCIAACPQVEAVLVLPVKDHWDEFQLVAFYKLREAVPIQDIIAFVRPVLPGYMIPAQWHLVNSMPLNGGRKPDVTALMTIYTAAQQETATPVKDDDKVLNLLMKICREVLRIQQVKPTDNFFRIRGDSIKAIRVLSLLRKEGYHLNMSDMLEFPVLQQLAMVINQANAKFHQDHLKGKLLPNAIQSNFFSVDMKDINWYNQSVILELKQDFPKASLQKIVSVLTQHHDVFRIRFHQKNGKYTGKYAETDNLYELSGFDVSFTDEMGALKAIMDELHATLDIQNGPLARFGMMTTSKSTYLAIVMHHLITDGVSWRILLDDINHLFIQLQNGESLHLPYRSTPFGSYLASMQQVIEKRLIDAEIHYWENVLLQKSDPLFNEYNPPYAYKDIHRLSKRFDPRLTDQIHHINGKLGTTANEVLIASLGLALQELFGVQQLLIHLEGRGRTEFDSGIDLSRTVGWFTALFPVHIDVKNSHTLPDYIRSVKEAIKNVPANGEGFGILHYLSGKFPGYQAPAICFNYLGDFSTSTETDFFSASGDEFGAWYSKERAIQHPVEVFVIVEGDHSLSITADFVPALMPHEQAQQLLTLIAEGIAAIDQACQGIEERLSSPSDFTFRGIKMDILDKLLSETGMLKDIYELVPTQEGLVHHFRKTGNRNEYVINANLFLNGTVVKDLLEKAFNILINRHDILRTTFRDDLQVGQTLQLVHKEHQATVVWKVLDNIDPATVEHIIGLLDEEERAAVSDIFSPVPNIRATLLKLSHNEYRLSFYYHHILADGWSAAVLLNELFTIYHLLQQHKDPYQEMETAPPFQFYIKWLKTLDHEAASRYWKLYLNEFAEPFAFRNNNKPGAGKEMTQLTGYIRSGDCQQVQEVLFQSGCTMYNYLQSVWALLLSHLSGCNDIVFGQVVSGRPPIAHADEMTGLFINTIPKRVRIDEAMSFVHLMKQVARDEGGSTAFHHYPLADILNQTLLKEKIFSHIIVYENQYQLLELEGRFTGGELQVVRFEGNDPNHYDICIVFSEDGDAMKMEWRFDKNQYDQDYLQQLMDDFFNLFQGACGNYDKPIAQILPDQSAKIDLPLLISPHS